MKNCKNKPSDLFEPVLKPKVALVANTSWYLWNFRLRLMLELQSLGYEVVAIAPPDEYSSRLKSNFTYVPWPLNRRSKNLLIEGAAFFKMIGLLHKVKPCALLTYTPKANIYGAVAARLLAVPIVNNIAGLGYAFIRKGLLASVVKMMYRVSLVSSHRIFFQNKDDMELFLREGIVRADQAEHIPGSGVDTECFAAKTDSYQRHPFVFLLMARMLWDKGVGEYVAAAKSLRGKHADVAFHLLGPLDSGNPAAISQPEIQSWVDEGVIEYFGSTDSVKDYIARAGCVVLPSYREGCPRSLLEAASMGKPIITTNAPGCRDVVDDGITGYLCKVRDGRDLAEKMSRLLCLTDDQRNEMGQNGRKKMVREFDEQIVLNRYTTVLQEICNLTV